MARMGIKGYDGEGGFSGVEGKFGRDPLLYQGNITGRGFGGETMRGARPRDWQTDPSDMDWNAFGNPMQDRMAPDLSGENPNYIQDSRKYIGDERYDEEDPAELASYYKGLADKGIGLPENRLLDEEDDHLTPKEFREPQDDARMYELLAQNRGPIHNSTDTDTMRDPMLLGLENWNGGEELSHRGEIARGEVGKEDSRKWADRDLARRQWGY